LAQGCFNAAPSQGALQASPPPAEASHMWRRAASPRGSAVAPSRRQTRSALPRARPGLSAIFAAALQGIAGADVVAQVLGAGLSNLRRTGSLASLGPALSDEAKAALATFPLGESGEDDRQAFDQVKAWVREQFQGLAWADAGSSDALRARGWFEGGLLGSGSGGTVSTSHSVVDPTKRVAVKRMHQHAVQ